MKEQMSFGSRLSHFRKAKKLSGEELGEIIGIGRGAISQIENDKTSITVPSLIKLKKKFNDLSTDWLLVEMGEMLLPDTKTTISSGACWDELEKEQKRYELLLQDYKQLQQRIKEQEAGE